MIIYICYEVAFGKSELIQTVPFLWHHELLVIGVYYILVNAQGYRNYVIFCITTHWHNSSTWSAPVHGQIQHQHTLWLSRHDGSIMNHHHPESSSIFWWPTYFPTNLSAIRCTTSKLAANTNFNWSLEFMQTPLLFMISWNIMDGQH